MCTTMKTGHPIIRLLCEFTITKWLDTGFNHATSGTWHSNNFSLAASPATVVETQQSFVISMSGAIPLIIFNWEREKKKLHTSSTFEKMVWLIYDLRLFLHILLPSGIHMTDHCLEFKKLVLGSFHDDTKKLMNFDEHELVKSSQRFQIMLCGV